MTVALLCVLSFVAGTSFGVFLMVLLAVSRSDSGEAERTYNRLVSEGVIPPVKKRHFEIVRSEPTEDARTW